MIVPPNFLDDWRMDVLATALDRDPMAPLYVLRLWSWCQTEKRWQFPDFDINKMRAICKAMHEPEAFMKAMEQAGYAERHEGGFSSSSWAALNAQLIAAWTNGKTGGRPPKKPSSNPTVTQGLNPTVTQGLNPTVTQGVSPTVTVGLTDKRREDEIHPSSAPIGATPPPSPAAAPVAPPPAPPPRQGPAAPAEAPATPPAPPPPGVDLFGGTTGRAPKAKPKNVQTVEPFLGSRPAGVSVEVWGEWLAYRLALSGKNKTAPFSAAAIKGVGTYLARCNAVGESSDDALLRSMAQDWKVPYPDRDMVAAAQRKNLPAMRRATANDHHAAAGAALAGFSRPQPTTTKPHGTDRPDPSEAEDIDYREKPRAAE